MWGCDRTKLLIIHIRWYLIVLIDFFSRCLIVMISIPLSMLPR